MREIEAREQTHREAEARLEEQASALALGRIEEGNEEEAAGAGGSRPGTREGGGGIDNGLSTGTGAGTGSGVGTGTGTGTGTGAGSGVGLGTGTGTISELPAIRQGSSHPGR